MVGMGHFQTWGSCIAPVTRAPNPSCLYSPFCQHLIWSLLWPVSYKLTRQIVLLWGKTFRSSSSQRYYSWSLISSMEFIARTSLELNYCRDFPKWNKTSCTLQIKVWAWFIAISPVGMTWATVQQFSYIVAILGTTQIVVLRITAKMHTISTRDRAVGSSC